MDRKKKIEILKALSEGKITIDSLKPARFYVFVTHSNKPGIYELDGEEYNEKQYQDKCEEIHKANKNNIIWNEGLSYQSITVKVITNEKN